MRIYILAITVFIWQIATGQQINDSTSTHQLSIYNFFHKHKNSRFVAISKSYYPNGKIKLVKKVYYYRERKLDSMQDKLLIHNIELHSEVKTYYEDGKKKSFYIIKKNEPEYKKTTWDKDGKKTITYHNKTA